MKKLFFIFFILSISQINSHEFNPAHLVIDEIDKEKNEKEFFH